MPASTKSPDKSPAEPKGKEAQAQLRGLFGANEGTQLWNQVREAGSLFGSDRYMEAQKLLEPIAKQAPDVPEVRELHGLVLYRLGHWRKAIRELEAFSKLADTCEQHPVICDCHRAMQEWHKTESVWQEFQATRPSGDLAAEGRIVYAGALSDQGKFAEAISLLESNWLPPAAVAKSKSAKSDSATPKSAKPNSTQRNPAKPTQIPSKTSASNKRPQECSEETSLRLVYMLADLYDRSGDAPTATHYFRWIASRNPDFVDVSDRLSELSD